MQSYIKISYELKKLLDLDKRFILLNEKEKAMESNEEVMSLSYNKDLKETYLSDLLKHYPSSSSEVKRANVELYRASEKLNSHPLVKEYLLAYKEVQKVLDEINLILFKDLK
ncbi:MAG: YlbF family regulator [Bacilli bacterium]|nr:YlbF family regulator [Bacilli bacterium]